MNDEINVFSSILYMEPWTSAYFNNRGINRTCSHLFPLVVLHMTNEPKRDRARCIPGNRGSIGQRIVCLMITHLTNHTKLQMKTRSMKYGRTNRKIALVACYKTTTNIALRGSSQMTLHKTKLTNSIINRYLAYQKLRALTADSLNKRLLVHLSFVALTVLSPPELPNSFTRLTYWIFWIRASTFFANFGDIEALLLK